MVHTSMSKACDTLTADSKDAAARELLRPVTWPVWLAWVLVCGLIPALRFAAESAISVEIPHHAQHRVLIENGLNAIILLAIVAPIVQGFVLKRVVTCFSFAIWFFCVLLSVILWSWVMRHPHGQAWPLVEAGLQAGRRLHADARSLRQAGTWDVMRMFGLPWGPLLLWTIAMSALTSLAPAWALGTVSGRRGAMLLFFSASIVGSCASAIVEQFYQIALGQIPHSLAQCGMPWSQRFHALSVVTGLGSVWGATAAIFVVLMTRRLGRADAGLFAPHHAGGFALVLIAPLAIALLAPFVGYLAGPSGLAAGIPDLRRAISFTPSQDHSQGEKVLVYAHDMAVPVTRIPTAAMAPDGRSTIVRTTDHMLVQVDLATGRSMRQLAGPLAASEGYAIAWSPDGRYLALRSHGAEAPIPNAQQRRSRVRLYALSDFTLAGEFTDRESACPDVFAPGPLLFTADSNSLWLACGQYARPTPENAIAIRLDVPTMEARDIRRYGEAAKNGGVAGLQRFGDSVWAWQFGSGGEPFRVSNLTDAREIVTMPMPTELIGRLTAQTGTAHVDEKTIRLIFCGRRPGAPADTDPASWICRTLSFDTQTGALTGSIDKPDHRMEIPSSGIPLSGHGLLIESFWRQDDKAGQLVVRDSATGRERQRITSVAQRPLQMSSDSAWLMTIGVYGGGLRLYRVHP